HFCAVSKVAGPRPRNLDDVGSRGVPRPATSPWSPGQGSRRRSIASAAESAASPGSCCPTLPDMADANEETDYELIDAGGGARLERFGSRVVDRPHPGALGPRRETDAWLAADLRFERDRGWSGPAASAGPWTIRLDAVTLELRPTEAGQVGV